MEKYNNQILILASTSIGITLTVSWLEIKPYGVIFGVGLIYYLLRTFFYSQLIKMTILEYLYEKYLLLEEKFSNFRERHPHLFIILAVIVLGLTGYVGHCLSPDSLVIGLIILIGIISAGSVLRTIRLVPGLANYFWGENAEQDLNAEFMPEVNADNLLLLEGASNQISSGASTLEDDEDRSDDIPSVLLPDSIPEIDENSSSEDDLAFKPPHIDKTKNKTKDSKLVFKTTYFKSESSTLSTSSSDEELSKGLNFDSIDSSREQPFSDPLPLRTSQSTPAVIAVVPSTSGTASSAQNIAAEATTTQPIILANQSPGFMAGLITWGIGNSIETDIIEVSDDSDFEILDTDEISN